MSRGKYWNLGLSNRDLLPATAKQLYALKSLSGVDHSSRGLNKAAASKLIDEYKDKKLASKRAKDISPTTDKLYETLMRMADEAATEASDAWLAANKANPGFAMPLSSSKSVICVGEIGTACLRIDRKEPLVTWGRKKGRVDGSGHVRIQFPLSFRPEVDLQLAAYKAAASILQKASIDGMQILRSTPGGPVQPGA